MSPGIPRSPAWCSCCIQSNEGPCADHRGPDGKPRDYSGHDVYTPSEWVLDVVGRRFSAWDYGYPGGTRTWECFGYDPRQGFWMRTVDDLAAPRETNISGSAIGRTWFPLRMTVGAWWLLEAVAELGRLPDEAEAKGRCIGLCHAMNTCWRWGLLTSDGQLSESGHQALQRTLGTDRLSVSDLRFLESNQPAAQENRS